MREVMVITAILCTYNRCEILAKALTSAAALVLLQSIDWEILVVDNNSSDRTREVTEDFCRRYPGRFRYLFEPQQGKSFALNSGIREARGEVLAFMDDDAIVEPDWLENLTKTLRNREWAGVGGRIFPEWSCAPPPWLPRESRYALAPLVAFDLGEQPHELVEAPFGANMAFRREMFEKYGGFRTDLGPHADCLISNEDSEFGNRLLAAGERLRYEPSAVVRHPVAQNRLQKDYFLAWWFNKGRSNTRQFGNPPNTKYYLCGIPLYLFRRLA